MAISAASLYQDLDPKSIYFDKRSGLSQDQYKEKLSNSTTLYVGNLSFYTSETQLLEFFQLCGEVVNLIMGLNQLKVQFKQPCGFCFVEYATRQEAALAIECLNLSVVDGRQIRIDWDPGFEPGRQYGRGKSGGQVRDELKPDFADKDRPVQRPQRGGYQRYSGGNYDSNRGGYRGGHGGGNYRNSDRSDYNRGGDRGNNYDNNNYRKRQDNDGGDDENNDNDSKRKRFRRDYSNDRNRNNNNDRDHDMN